MGVKFKLTKKDLKGIINVKKILPTKDGITDTVYILDNKYILKIFHNSSKKDLKNEIKLLKLLKKYKVSKPISKSLTICNKPALLYKKCIGQSIKKPKKKDIKQIGKFLKKFHNLTKNKLSNNKKIFKKQYLKKLVIKTKNKSLLDKYKKIDIKLKNNGIIHGDLFPDNSIFYHGKLSCVIDFNQACNGDFIFDLAVIAFSWCKSNNDIKILLKSYNLNISLKKFKKYIFYASLYYTTTRYLRKI